MKPLITFAVTFATCLTTLAQRTPIKVNGTVLSNPNFTNTSTISLSSSGSDLSVNLIDPVATGSTTGRSLPTRFAQVKNVRDFGAVGDGVANDQAAIQAAANAIPTLSGGGPWSGGGVLEVPSGTYRVNSTITLKPGTILRGVGRHPARLVSYTTSPMLVADGAVINSAYNLVVENLLLDGSQIANSGDGLVILSGKEGIIANIEAWGFQNGVVISNAQVFTVRDSKFRNNRLDGLQTVGSCNALVVSGCYSANNSRHGYSVTSGTYVNFTGCASDSNGGAGYASITSSQNLSFIACGTELCDVGYFSENARNLSMFGCYSVLTTNDAVRLDGVRQASLINVNAGNTSTGYGLNIRTSTNATTSFPVVAEQCTFTGTTGNINDSTKIIAIGRIGGSAGAGDGIGVWDNASADVPFLATIAGGQTNFLRLAKTAVNTWEVNITAADLGIFSGTTRVFNLDDLAPVNALDVGQSAVTVNNPLVGTGTLDITGNTVLRASLHRVGGTATDSRFAWYLTPSVTGDGSQGVGMRVAPVMSATQTSNADAIYVSYNATSAQPLSRGILIDNPSGTVTNNAGIAILAQTRGSAANTALLIGTGSPAPGNYEIYALGTYPSFFGGQVKFSRSGTAAMTGGTVTVANATVTASTLIFLTTQTPGGAVGSPYVSARSAGVSFTITSTSGTDTSTVGWIMFEP